MFVRFMKKHNFLIVLFGFFTLTLSAEEANLQGLLNRITQQTFSADFAMAVSEKVNEPMVYTGKMQIKGEKFTVFFNHLQVAFDGKTLYWLDKKANELTLSYPTPTELYEANPFSYAQQMKNKCTENITTTKNITTITLIPKEKESDVSKCILKLNHTNWLLQSVEIKERSGKTTLLTFRNTKYSSENTTFSINQGDAYLNDLR